MTKSIRQGVCNDGKRNCRAYVSKVSYFYTILSFCHKIQFSVAINKCKNKVGSVLSDFRLKYCNGSVINTVFPYCSIDEDYIFLFLFKILSNNLHDLILFCYLQEQYI